MMPRALFLSFPQWQGAGDKDTMGESSATLKRLFPQHPWIDVAVASASSSSIERGIRGRQTLIEQLDVAQAVVHEAAPDAIYTLGGDCSVEFAPVSWLAKRYGDGLSLLWLDAHPDLSTPETSLTANLHGMVLLSLFGRGDDAFVARLPSLVSPASVVLAGVRDIDPHERPLIESYALPNVMTEDLNAHPEALVAALEKVGRPRVYVHFDLDVLEPRSFPSIAFPIAHGVRPEPLLEAFKLIRSQFDIVGACITEYVARDDRDRRTIEQIGRALFP